MKKIKQLFIFPVISLVIAFAFMMSANAVQSYTMSISNAASVTKGSNLTLTFTAKNLSGITAGFDGYEGYVNFDSSKLEYVSMTNSVSGWVSYPNATAGKIKFMGYDDNPPANAKTSDTVIFKMVFKALVDSGSTSITATTLKGSTGAGVKIVADDVSTTVSFGPAAAVKSSDATLKGLTVGGGYSLTPAFSSGTTSYKIDVPNDVTSLDVSAMTNNSAASVVVSGNNGFKVGNNNIVVEVTAENGTKKSYTITVNRASAGNSDSKPSSSSGTSNSSDSSNKSSSSNKSGSSSTSSSSSKSSNNSLKSISGIQGLDFDPNKTEYNITIPFEISSLDVSATAQNSKSKVQISNGKISNMAVGETKTISIAVTSEDGSLKIYTINVTRSQYTSETSLKSLVVNGQELIGREEEDGSYSVFIDRDFDKLSVNAIPLSDGSKVKIIGNEKLKNGDNVITIQVTDKNGFTKNYTLNVKKKSLLWFVHTWWFWVILLVALMIALFVYLHNKNNEKIKQLSRNQNALIEHEILEDKEIDRDRKLLYNSIDNNRLEQSYMPRHSDSDIMDNNVVENLLRDDNVSSVEKELRVIRNQIDNDDLEKEYKIIERLKRK